VTAIAPAMAFGHDEMIYSDGALEAGVIQRDIHQHGETDGHLPGPSTPNIDVVSKLALPNVEPGKIADVGVSADGDTAFLAAWGGETCTKNGIHVVDISDPAAPEETGFIVSKEGSAPGEGVQTAEISTPKFNGEILVTNNETCKAKVGFGGMNIYDVTNGGNRHRWPSASVTSTSTAPERRTATTSTACSRGMPARRRTP